MTLLRRVLAAASLAAAAGAGYTWRESKHVEPTETVLRVPELPMGLDGLRILHVSDTHFPANAESLPRFLATARAQRYDLVIGTGDYVDSQRGWHVAAQAFREIDPALGMFGVIGGHDRYASPRWSEIGPRLGSRLGGRQIERRAPRRRVDPAPFIEDLESAGMRVLINARTSIEIRGERLDLVGVDDAYLALDDLDAALGAASGAPSGEPGFAILLSHSPDALRDPRAARFPVAFAGHTHGGQIRIPGFGAPVRHASTVTRHQASGLLRIGPTQVVISRGFGTTLVPLRLACRPEVGVVELRCEDGPVAGTVTYSQD
jgi:predicted MPP superfamily phosphohydrolase